MKPFLTDEQRQALDRQPEGIEVEDGETHKVYVIAEAELHQRAMAALRRQEDLTAIQNGIDDMEAGHVVPIEEASRQIRAQLKERYGLPLSDV